MPSESEVQRIAAEAATMAIAQFVNGPGFRTAISAAVDEALAKYGVDVNSPDQSRRDLMHLRVLREFNEFVLKKGIGSFVTWVVTFVMGAMMIGVGVLVAKYGVK